MDNKEKQRVVKDKDWHCQQEIQNSEQQSSGSVKTIRGEIAIEKGMLTLIEKA